VIAGRVVSMQKDGLIPDEMKSLSCSVSTSLALHVPQGGGPPTGAALAGYRFFNGPGFGIMPREELGWLSIISGE
jgi:hypothetical protein